MPLLKGKENVGRNIKELISSGYPRKQAIAISMDTLKREIKKRAKRGRNT